MEQSSRAVEGPLDATVVPLAPKRCGGCQRDLPRSAFAKNKKNLDGLYTYCRDCSAERRRAWRERNADHVKQYARTYSQEHREQINAKRRGKPASAADRARVVAWVAANRDRYLASKRQYYQAHKTTLAPAMRARYERMRDELHDYYVAAMLCQGTELRPQDIPAELIAMKRDQLRFHRLVASLDLAIQGEKE